MAVDELAHLGMMTLRAGFSRQILLVIRSELCIELRCVT
jgi:hypothetical protein